MEQMFKVKIIVFLQVLWYFDCVFTAIFALEVVVKVRKCILLQFCVDFTVFVSVISSSWRGLFSLVLLEQVNNWMYDRLGIARILATCRLITHSFFSV